MRFEKPLYPQSASAHLILFLNDHDEQRHELFLSLKSSYLSCKIDNTVTVGCDLEAEQLMVSFHGDHGRFLSQRIVLTEVGTRCVFELALKETSFATNHELCKEVLDVICSFSKFLNLYFESS